ncbi:MAG: glutamate formimidoyltransferase [Dehalococcoidia bacterium]
MRRIVECIPNFSEGRDRSRIESIVRAIEAVPGVKVLDVDVSASYNRSVVTFVGAPQEVKEGALAGISRAVEVIDMSQHKGEHPRLGACDVCPFVPIGNTAMADCIAAAEELGSEVADRLSLPVYLYGEAARSPERRNLSRIRAGQYEGLEEKLQDPAWEPDFGPTAFSRRSGAVVIGAREFLIAYNVNLKAGSKKAVDIISGRIRESGWTEVLDDGTKVRHPGAFREVKALGVYLDDLGVYQVSTNLTNYRITPPHEVFEMVKRLSQGVGEVFGSEIVGLVPREAILAAGRFYSPAEQSESGLVASAIDDLGLNSLKEFNPRTKIIEYLIEED